MAKRLLLAALGLIYAATAVVVVHSLAENYRRSVREQRATLALASARNARGAGAVDEPPALPQPTPPASASASASGTGPVAHPERPRDQEPRTTARQAQPPGPELARTRPEPPPAPEPYLSPVKLKPLVLAGLVNATGAEEETFGAALNKLIVINHPAVEDGSPLQRTLLEAAQPLLDLRTRKDVEIKLVVLDSDDVNAFSHVGGYLYVTRGLLNFAGTDDEFQFVVGHELAHVELKHGQELVAALTRDGTVEKVGSLQAMYHQVAAGYTEAQELAADDWVIDRMVKLDHTPRECLMYLRKLRRLSDELKFREGRKAPKTPPEATVQEVENHVRAGPAIYQRLGRLETRLKATPARPGAVGPPASGP